MAAIASQRVQQRKSQAVYGKHRRAAGASNFFSDDEDELALPAPMPARSEAAKKPTQEGGLPVKESYPVTKPAIQTVTAPVDPPKRKGALPSKAMSPPKKVDTFDIPSSDDEVREDVRYMPVAPKAGTRERLFDDRAQVSTDMDPFGRSTGKVTKPRSPAACNGEKSGEATGSQKRQDSAKARLISTREKKNTGNDRSATTQQFKEVSATISPPDLSGLSAGERLRLRAKQAGARSSGDEASQGRTNVAKRSDVAPDVTSQPQTKRRRMTPQEARSTTKSPKDIEMAERPVSKGSSAGTPDRKSSPRNNDIYDIPIDDDLQLATTATAKIAAIRARRNRAQAPVRTSRRTVPQQSKSAIEDLTRMIPNDTDVIIIDSSTSTPARASPPQPTSTPSRKSPNRQVNAVTPKQTQTWANFFEPIATPSADLEKLDLSGRAREAKAVPVSRQKAFVRSSSDIPKRRVRLVDRLKATAVSSSEPESSDDNDDNEEEADDPVMINKAVKRPAMSRNNSQKPIEPTIASQNSQTRVQIQSQSQERPLQAADTGSNVTYAKQRSYLAEESLEDIMLDVPLEPPQRPAATARRTGKPAAAAKTAAFDLDESDDNGPTGLRTIHELRAGGRATRVMGEISALMGEIAVHSAGGRSRRRGALLELGSQLLDKTFAAEQFVGHGFEQHLLAEIHAPADAVADSLLATCFLLLLGAELPAHTAQCFAMALPWLAKLLPDSADISKVVKDRRNNMSRSAQGDVVAFVGNVQALGSLWEDCRPTTMSSRLVAMKALDFLIGALRQQGDRSEFFDTASLISLLPSQSFTIGIDNANAVVESNTSISVLEALSTLSATTAWPREVMAAIATLPAVFTTEPSEQDLSQQSHTKWIAYRLLLNLSNNTTLDSTLFSSHNATPHLLREVVYGFEHISSQPTASQTSEPATADVQASHARGRDILLLAECIMYNLAEYSVDARKQAITPVSLPSLERVVQFYLFGLEGAAEVESMEESHGNVTVGYAGVMLAGLCLDPGVRTVVGKLLGNGDEAKGMEVLETALEEFVRVHQMVDGAAARQVGFEGEEGKVVWSAFTERMVGVLGRLKGRGM